MDLYYWEMFEENARGVSPEAADVARAIIALEEAIEKANHAYRNANPGAARLLHYATAAATSVLRGRPGLAKKALVWGIAHLQTPNLDRPRYRAAVERRYQEITKGTAQC